MRYRINSFWPYAVMASCMFLINGCDDKPDFRDDFVGEYRCHYTASVLLYEDGNPYLYIFEDKHDTILKVRKGEEFDQIEFIEKIWTINEDGKSLYLGCVDSSKNCGHLVAGYLDFVSDSISLFAQSGGAGYTRYTANGIKISDN